MTFSRNEIILAAKAVSLAFDGKDILRDISFSVHNIVRPGLAQGQVVSLIGRSGIGKTQLFKIIAGLQQPDTGEVSMGADQHRVVPGEVGIVPQNYILFNHRTVLENLCMGMKGKDKQGKIEIAKEYAERFMLSEHLYKYPMQLSGGQRQRVSIIQQVLTGNQFILLDEPFSGLDALMTDRVVELLIRVSTLHDHNTLIIVSHDIENALAISDTAFVLARETGREGATITQTLDLVGMDLAWNPGIREEHRFQSMVKEIKYLI